MHDKLKLFTSEGDALVSERGKEPLHHLLSLQCIAMIDIKLLNKEDQGKYKWIHSFISMANRKSISYTIAYSYEAEGIGEAKNVGFPIISPLSIFRSTLFAYYRVIIMHP